MSRIYEKWCIVFIFLVWIVSVHAQEIILTKQQAKEDLVFLLSELKANHPNLYTYTTEEILNDWYTSQSQSMDDSLSHKEMFEIISSISPILMDGHSYIYPSESFIKYFFTAAPLFPLDVFSYQNDLVVLNDWSTEQTIPKGAKILAINDIPIDDIKHKIINGLSRDGKNIAYPEFVYHEFFPTFYAAHFGFNTTYSIRFEDASGNSKTEEIKGMERSRMRMMRNKTPKVSSEKGIRLDVKNDLAVLTIPSFSNSMLKKDYGQKFKKEISDIFESIQNKGIESLVIDLRGNQGGQLSNGIYLLKHFMNQPFRCVSAYYKTSKKNKEKQQLVRMNSKWDDLSYPTKKNHFDGKVFLWTNGGSFSCSSIVAKTFKEEKRGMIIGQMTGGSAYTNCGGPDKSLVLPHSKILFTIPKTKYDLVSDMSEIKLGVEPDIFVEDHFSRYWNPDDDPYLDKVMEMME